VVISTRSFSLSISFAKNSDRAITAKPVNSNAQATAVSVTSSNDEPADRLIASSTYTPPTAAGTEPKAIHVDSPISTVPWRKCRHPPTVFVTAP
jgi:PIN domain nuclease of toxin-antitoxin system